MHMANGTLLVGEPMGLFIAQQEGAFEDVESYLLCNCGAEFNVAVGLARLQHKVGYFTKLGDDPFAKKIVKMMNQEKINTDLIQYSDEHPTGFMLKGKVSSGNPHIFYFRKNSAASTLCGDDIEKLDFSAYDSIHMTGITPALSNATKEATERLLNKAKQHHMLYSFDPNLRPQLWPDTESMCSYINNLASKCDIFFPGVEEAHVLIGTTDAEKIAKTYMDAGAKAVVVKLGAQGAYYATSQDSGYVAGYPVDKVIDTVGAGDGFAVGVLSALKENLSMEEAVRRGNAIGAIQVMSVGDNDGLPTREELQAFMAGEKIWRKGNG
ncbi:MAG: sugar kinase [Angelakisella sp.]|nr:sugar kinase [Angelakisella sp.]